MINYDINSWSPLSIEHVLCMLYISVLCMHIGAYVGADKAGSKRIQPPWQPPSGSVNVGLQIFNSLTRKKVRR